MARKIITFQLAINHLSKVALSLERLFITLDQSSQEKHSIIHHYALKNVIEIVKLTEKPELKSRFLKELMRIEHSVKKLQFKLSTALYDDLLMQIQLLNHLSGRFGNLIHHDPLLQSVRIIQSAHPIDCEFNAPQLYLWLEDDYKIRQHDLIRWLEDLRTLDNTVRVYLNLLRHCVLFESIEMSHGFYQRSLASQIPCQLILLSIAQESGIIPKMQLGHNSLNIRLFDARTLQEIQQVNLTIELGICYL